MAVVVNNPTPTREDTSSNAVAFILGLIFLVVLAFLFFYYGLPAIRGASGGVNVSVPIQVPEKVDVQVQQPK